MSSTTDHLPPRSDDLAAVLDAVRRTGMSAHPRRGEQVSSLVLAVAVARDCNPRDLQDEVTAYAVALDDLAAVRAEVTR